MSCKRNVDWADIMQHAHRVALSIQWSDKEAARDIAQDSVLRLLEWGKVEQYENHRALTSKFVRGEAADYRKSACVRHGSEELDEDHAIVPAGYDAAMEARQELEVAMAKLASRPRTTQRVMRMRYLDGLSIAAIARRLGVTAQAVDARLSDGRRAIGAKPRGRKTCAKRDAEIVRLVQSGKTQAEVGRKFGLTYARVSQILKASRVGGE